MLARTRRTAPIAALALVSGLGVLTGCSGGAELAEPPDGPLRPGLTGTVQTAPPPPDRLVGQTRRRGPTRAESPREVVRQITAAEDTIARRSTRPGRVAAAGRVQQLAYRVLATHPAWDQRVRRLLPARHLRDTLAHVASRRAFGSMHGELSDTLPAWRIVEPLPADELLALYRRAGERYDVDWEFLAAINLVESGLGRIRGTSLAGAQGPMQFMPATWAQYGRGHVDDPADAIAAAARYLDAMGYSRGSGGVDEALYRYNNHPAYVLGVRLIAETMERDPRAFLGLHAWEVYYLTDRGEVRLPVGYAQTREVPVGRYLARNR